VLDKKGLRRIYLRRRDLQEAGENYIMRNFMTQGISGSWRGVHNEIRD
jgi:hypothetical protein